jgi:molecular chaperone GrpE
MNENPGKAEKDKKGRAERADPADPAAPGADSPWETSAAEDVVRLAAEKAELEAEKADLTDRLVRLAAEMDNLRKRTERDVAEANKYAVTRFAADMLVVADNLQRALATLPADRGAASAEALAGLVEGVEMTGREMQRLLERHGVKPIAAMGERFDPHRHQAMYEVPDASVAPGTVVEVVQDGYQVGDRVLRAALVAVAKAPTGGRAEGSAADETTA